MGGVVRKELCWDSQREERCMAVSAAYGPNHRLQATGNSLRSCVAAAAPRAWSAALIWLTLQTVVPKGLINPTFGATVASIIIIFWFARRANH